MTLATETTSSVNTNLVLSPGSRTTPPGRRATLVYETLGSSLDAGGMWWDVIPVLR